MDRRKFLSGAITASAGFNATRSESQKGEITEASYVIAELLGYKKLAGRMSQGPAGLLQLDVAVEGGYVTQLINPNSVYRITVVDEATVRELAKHIDPLPRIELEVPPRQQFLGYAPDDDGPPF